MAAPRTPLPLVLLLVSAALLALAPLSPAAETGAAAFDVRRHLSTVTRYAAASIADLSICHVVVVGFLLVLDDTVFASFY